MELIFKLNFREFIVNQNSEDSSTKKQFILSTLMILEKFNISHGYDKYDEEIEKILNYQIENKSNVDSRCNLYVGNETDNYWFRIEKEYCVFDNYLSQEKILKLYEHLMMDDTKYQTKLIIGITITDTHEIKKDEYGYQLKLSEFHFSTIKMN